MLNHPIKQRLGIHVAIWVSLLLLTIAVFSLFYPLRIVAIFSAANWLMVAILFYSNQYLVNRYLEQKRFIQAISLGFLIFLLISGLRISFNYTMLSSIPKPQEPALFSLVGRISGMVIVTSSFTVLFAVAMQLILNRLAREKETMDFINAQQSAQLNFLKAQINPHFLFNALNNIYSLTVLKSPDAPRMLLQLSELLRYVIYDSRQEAVLLEKEILYIGKFIQLFEMRSERPPNIVFDVTGSAGQRTIEPMILIPIVENCFKHCDFDQNPHSYARIQLIISEKDLAFSTVNTYNQRDQQKDEVGGVGLENIRKRLAFLYPERHSFEFRADNGIFSLQLHINQ